MFTKQGNKIEENQKILSKTCLKCKEEKLFNEFHKEKGGKFGLRSECKICRKKKARERIEKYKEFWEKNEIEHGLKICSTCKKEKDIKAFFLDRSRKDGLRLECKICFNRYRKNNLEEYKNREKQYYQENKEIKKEYRESKKKEKAEYDKIYREKNKRKKAEYDKIYQEEHREEINERKRAYYRNRKKIDIEYYLRCRVSTCIYQYLKQNSGKKNNNSILKYLPYTIQQLKEHLELQFEDWMTWDNHGVYILGGPRTWHIDHIIPQSLLSYDSMEHPNFKKCWALDNLRPYDAMANIQKSNNLK